jgi:phage shock protein PspC (stress-responsive transcriptional regulator)
MWSAVISAHPHNVSGTQRSQPHPLAGAEDTVKDFWNSRPRRPRRGRKVAGVAAAIGNRYAIDPVIVRVAFVVTAFYGGAGVLLYLACWLFFPEQNDEEAPFMSMVNQGRSSTSTFFTVLLCGAMIGVSFWTFSGTGAGLVGLILLLIAMYLLHRSRASMGLQHRERPADPVLPQQTMDLGAPMDAPMAEPETRTQPPAWDPLGAAPFAWDLPEPAPAGPEPEPPAPRRRAKVGGITLGAALAVGGGLWLASPYTGWLSAPHIVGIVLAVIGIGMVGGSLVGGGRGLIGLAVPLALAGFVLTNTTGPDGRSVLDERWGNIAFHPTSASEVMPSYDVGGGSVDLDLTQITSGVAQTDINVGLGNISVIVPANADVEVACSSSLGSLECLGQERNGADAAVSTTDNGTDGPGGPKIYLHARANSGTVEVRRG